MLFSSFYNWKKLKPRILETATLSFSLQYFSHFLICKFLFEQFLYCLLTQLLCGDPLWGLLLPWCWAFCEFLRKDISLPAIWKLLFKMSLLIPYVHFHTCSHFETVFYRFWPDELSFILFITCSVLLFALILRGFLDFMCQLLTCENFLKKIFWILFSQHIVLVVLHKISSWRYNL